ncbi:piggyBac transposable element-derived protein 3-like [Centruroides sculpturatus]|uniref:piggyBac transposable element-derived protein 3-like n=1 Tax=Centruroides sculpturatus TaxID=218467 RepID=UPI000C6ED877|nr:piggyBac transposable element-derived protein 3-like [Centruroides sculpturatus]
MDRRLIDEEIDDLLLEEFPSDIDTPVEDSTDDESENECDQISPQTDIAFILFSEESDDDDSDEEEVTSNPSIKRNFRKREKVSTVPSFSLTKGTLNQFFKNKTTPTNVFLTVLGESTISNIVFQSNLYSQQKQINIKTIRDEEMYGFLGLQFLFGYHCLPQTHHYWCSDIDLCIPIVREVMARERYKQILSNLHVNDNLSIPSDNKDKLYKIRPLITVMNKNFKKFRLPDQFQSIDESMVKFKGRSSLKQYNPMKPVKRGYKLWCRADMSGYIYEFIIYQEKRHGDSRK